MLLVAWWCSICTVLYVISWAVLITFLFFLKIRHSCHSSFNRAGLYKIECCDTANMTASSMLETDEDLHCQDCLQSNKKVYQKVEIHAEIWVDLFINKSSLKIMHFSYECRCDQPVMSPGFPYFQMHIKRWFQWLFTHCYLSQCLSILCYCRSMMVQHWGHCRRGEEEEQRM